MENFFSQKAKDIDDAFIKIKELEQNRDLEITNMKRSKLENYSTIYSTKEESKFRAAPLRQSTLNEITETEQQNEAERIKKLETYNLKEQKLINIINEIFE
jgi:hypothetical protein